MAAALPSYWLKLWMNGFGRANQWLIYFCCSSSRVQCFQHDSSWGEQLRMLYYQMFCGCLFCSKPRQQHCHCWSSTTVYQSEFQCESKQADPAGVSVQKIPWSWECPEPSWRCLQHAGCHFSLVNHSPPCKHHQWSPPVETKLELTTCRHEVILTCFSLFCLCLEGRFPNPPYHPTWFVCPLVVNWAKVQS